MSGLEQRHAERDRRDAELAVRYAAEDTARREAAHQAHLLPAPLGDAITALFAALEPVRANYGELAHPVIGRCSPEVAALAEAVIEVTSGVERKRDG